MNERKRFLEIPTHNIKAQSEKHQISLRKKHKQNMFRKNRFDRETQKTKSKSLLTKTPKELFDEIAQLMLLSNWEQRICSQLEQLSTFFENDKSWYELIELTEFSNAIITILKNGLNIFDQEPDESNLSNVKHVLKLIENITYNYHESSMCFIKNGEDNNLVDDIIYILNNSFKSLARMKENICSLDKKEEVIYFHELIISWTAITANLYFEFYDKSSDCWEILSTELTSNMQYFAEWVYENAKSHWIDKEIREIFDAISQFINWVSRMEIEDIAMNAASNLFEMFTHIFNCILKVTSEEPIIDWEDLFNFIIEDSLKSISNIIDLKEWLLIEFLGAEHLPSLIMQILKESLNFPDNYKKTIEIGWGIFQSISSQEGYDSKLKDIGAYDVLFDLIYHITHHKSLLYLMVSLQNMQILSDYVRKRVSTKNAILFLAQMGTNTTHFELKWEYTLWITNIIEVNKENQEWSSMFYFDKEIIEQIIKSIWNILVCKTQVISVLRNWLEALDWILTSENEYYDNAYGEDLHSEKLYYKSFIDNDIINILEDINTSNEDIKGKVEYILVNHQLKDLGEEDVEDLIIDIENKNKLIMSSGQ